MVGLESSGWQSGLFIVVICSTSMCLVATVFVEMPCWVSCVAHAIYRHNSACENFSTIRCQKDCINNVRQLFNELLLSSSNCHVSSLHITILVITEIVYFVSS